MTPVTVSQMVVDVQGMVDDANNPTATQLLRYLNQARNKIFSDTQCFTNDISTSSQAYVTTFPLPGDVYDVQDIRHIVANGSHKPLPFTKAQFGDLDMTSSTGFTGPNAMIDRCYKQDRTLNFWPKLAQGAYTDTLAAQISAADTSMTLTTGTSLLPYTGKCLIGSEVIQWLNKDDSTATLSPLVRGVEGTTAAIHLISVPFTHRDIYINYYQYPTDLTTINTIDQMFAYHYMMIEYFMAWQAKLKDTDDIQASGVNQQAANFYNLFRQEFMLFKLWIQGREDGLIKIDVVD